MGLVLLFFFLFATFFLFTLCLSVRLSVCPSVFLSVFLLFSPFFLSTFAVRVGPDITALVDWV